MCIKVVKENPWWLKDVPDKFKTQEIYDKEVRRDPRYLEFIPDLFKKQEMCIKVVEEDSYQLWCIPDHLKSQAMCERANEKFPYNLRFVPDYFKTRKMCKGVVEKYPWALKYIPDWFVASEQLNLWRDYHCPYHNNEMIKWYEGYKKQKVQKAEIKEEVIPIAWHPSRWYDWCISEDEKKETEKLWK